jgi:hypothetical protein
MVEVVFSEILLEAACGLDASNVSPDEGIPNIDFPAILESHIHNRMQ